MRRRKGSAKLEAKYTFQDIVGRSDEIRIAVEQAKIAARTPATVLLRGESGTGKELFAHAIHNESDRKYNKFIRVNCAALSESLLESELFGYEEGAFSGAKRGGKKGLFEEADNGSLFLDEIGELSAKMQVKLLRVLQEKEIIRVGGTEPIPVNVRIIAATNRNLEREIAAGKFREDLYYRLNRIPIHIAPLRQRKEDIPPLCAHLIRKINHDYGRSVEGISPSALKNWKATIGRETSGSWKTSSGGRSSLWASMKGPSKSIICRIFWKTGPPCKRNPFPGFLPGREEAFPSCSTAMKGKLSGAPWPKIREIRQKRRRSWDCPSEICIISWKNIRFCRICMQFFPTLQDPS